MIGNPKQIKGNRMYYVLDVKGSLVYRTYSKAKAINYLSKTVSGNRRITTRKPKTKPSYLQTTGMLDYNNSIEDFQC